MGRFRAGLLANYMPWLERTRSSGKLAKLIVSLGLQNACFKDLGDAGVINTTVENDLAAIRIAGPDVTFEQIKARVDETLLASSLQRLKIQA